MIERLVQMYLAAEGQKRQWFEDAVVEAVWSENRQSLVVSCGDSTASMGASSGSGTVDPTRSQETPTSPAAIAAAMSSSRSSSRDDIRRRFKDIVLRSGLLPEPSPESSTALRRRSISSSGQTVIHGKGVEVVLERDLPDDELEREMDLLERYAAILAGKGTRHESVSRG